jgi:arylsulfatase A-like enzyme
MSRIATDRAQVSEETIGHADRLQSIPEAVNMSPRPRSVLVFAVWLGLATGLLEVVLLFVRRNLLDSSAVSSLQLNQHARWMIPISHVMIFGACGLILAAVVALTRSRKLVGMGVYGLCFLSSLALLQVTKGLTTIACSSLAGGFTFWIAPCLLAHARQPSRLVGLSLPALIGLVGVFFGVNAGREKLDERSLPTAAPGSPNVLFIVLDTVRAESLSLYGYERETSPHLKELAERGVRFDQARAAAAWTLPSHASMFTGRWPYELSTCPDRPLDDTYPTLAEFLRNHGYATAGFAANTYFCSLWYGLGRGFMHYEDIALTPIEILRSSIMGRYLVRKISPYNSSRPTAYFERKDAVTINSEVVSWLSTRPAGRPFFAFLNYYDAHDPYLSPKRPPHPFGRTPASSQDFATLRDWLEVVKKRPPARTVELARDCYDDCIAYLDDQVGRLFSELGARGLLENTLVVVTADHGELMGERGEFGHGQSLHHEVVNVPLLVVAPRRVPSGRVVPTPVSLRDLPATVVDLLGLGRESPFPGRSLARHWSSASIPGPENDDLILTETADEVSWTAITATTGRSLVERNNMYIRKKDGREELYDLAIDRAELHDLSGSAESQPVLAHFRETMHHIDRQAENLERQRRLNRKNARPAGRVMDIEGGGLQNDL